LGFAARRAWLCELASDAANFHHRLRASVGEDHGHLQEYAEEVADIVRAMLCEALGAIATLQQERLAIGDRRKLSLQLACFTSKNQRWIGCELLLGLGQSGSVRISRNLLDWLASPGVRGPIVVHFAPIRHGRATCARKDPIGRDAAP